MSLLTQQLVTGQTDELRRQARRHWPPRGRKQSAQAVRLDYDEQPERFRLARVVSRRLGVCDVHERVGRRFVDEGLLPVLGVGCGEGELARHLPNGAWIGVDSSPVMLARAPSPATCADARQLPFAAGSFDAVAPLYVLYHLPDPARALREAQRVQRPGGLIAVAAPSRYDAPELARVVPNRQLTFDAETMPGALAEFFGDVELRRWEAPLLTLATAAEVRDFLIGKGVEPGRAWRAAQDVATPLTVTKRGALAFARRGTCPPTC